METVGLKAQRLQFAGVSSLWQPTEGLLDQNPMKFIKSFRLLALAFCASAALQGFAVASDKEAGAEVGKTADGGAKRAAKPVDDYYELYQLLADTVDQVERNYVKEVDRRELIEAAIRGMLAKLDPYSTYIGPDELAQFRSSVESEFGGIGIQIADGRRRPAESSARSTARPPTARASWPATASSKSTARAPTACRSTTPSA